MKQQSAVVQSVFDFAIREINALEQRIVTAEDEADAMLWEQAEQVVAQIKAGLSGRELARQWISVRTGEAYDEKHVRRVREVWRQGAALKPRPRFRDLYNEIANAPAKGAHVSHNSGNDEWYTPAEYIEAARTVMGAIDLDPATTAEANTVVKASRYFTREDNGLEQPWSGRVWLNPPYAHPEIEGFVDKLNWSIETADVSAAVVLVNNATETEWFGRIAAIADAVCFPTGRVRFWSPDRESATPLQGQAILYIGYEKQRFLDVFSTFGVVLVRQVKIDDVH